jgi:hypothetical protein
MKVDPLKKKERGLVKQYNKQEYQKYISDICNFNIEILKCIYGKDYIIDKENSTIINKTIYTKDDFNFKRFALNNIIWHKETLFFTMDRPNMSYSKFIKNPIAIERICNCLGFTYYDIDKMIKYSKNNDLSIIYTAGQFEQLDNNLESVAQNYYHNDKTFTFKNIKVSKDEILKQIEKE